MALTYQEQIDIADGTAVLKIDLKKFCATGAIATAIDFLTNQKQFDTTDVNGNPINSDAQNYLQKIVQLCNAVLNYERDNRKFILDSIARNMVAILATKAFQYGAIKDATANQWETFIAANMWDETAITVFDLMAGVTRKEKLAYKNLP